MRFCHVMVVHVIDLFCFQCFSHGMSGQSFICNQMSGIKIRGCSVVFCSFFGSGLGFLSSVLAETMWGPWIF